MFGMNPWDISLVYGIGDKNDAHPHHRASNPEGKNAPGLSYKYRPPVGGLLGGITPDKTNSWIPSSKSWEDYHISETCLDASATLLSALTLVSNGGNDYFEKQCNNCKSDSSAIYSGEGVYATTYHYTFSDIDFFNLQIHNNTMDDLDSVVAYIYFDATEEDVDACGAIFDHDICQIYDIAGFNKPCSNDRAIREFIRANGPVKIEDTYNKDKKTYTWAQAINVGSIGFGSKLHIDIAVTSGTKSSGTCETTRTPAKIKVTDAWSFTAHTETKEAPSYAGTPDWEKEQGDIQDAPKDPYIVVRNKNQLLWGYGPAKTTNDRVSVVKHADIAKARMQISGNRLYVLASAQGTKTVKLFDLLGNQLMEHTFNETRTEISLANLPHRGTLIAKVTQNGKQLTTRTFRY
jgi:hypothetical protein